MRRILVTGASLTLLVALASPAQADTFEVSIVGEIHECAGIELTVQSGTLRLVDTVTTNSDGSVRIVNQWSIVSPVTLKDAMGNSYVMKDLGGGTWSDVTVAPGGYPAGIALTKWAYDRVKGGRLGTDKGITNYYSDGTSTYTQTGTC